MADSHQQHLLTRCMAIENKVMAQTQLVEQHLREHKSFLEMLAENIFTQTWQSKENKDAQINAAESAATQTKYLEDISNQMKEHKILLADNLTATNQQSSENAAAQKKNLISVTSLRTLIDEKLERMTAQNNSMMELMQTQLQEIQLNAEDQKNQSAANLDGQIKLIENLTSQSSLLEENLIIMRNQNDELLEAVRDQSHQNLDGMTSQTKILEESLNQITNGTKLLTMSNIAQTNNSIENKAFQTMISEKAASLFKIFQDNLTEMKNQNTLLANATASQTQKLADIIVAQASQSQIQVKMEENTRNQIKLLESTFAENKVQNAQLIGVVATQNEQLSKIYDTMAQHTISSTAARKNFLNNIEIQNTLLDKNFTFMKAQNQQLNDTQTQGEIILGKILECMTAENTLMAKSLTVQAEQSQKVFDAQSEHTASIVLGQTKVSNSLIDQNGLLGNCLDRMTAQNNLLARIVTFITRNEDYAQTHQSLNTTLSSTLNESMEVQTNVLETILSRMTAQNNLLAKNLNQKSNDFILAQIQQMLTPTPRSKNNITQTKILKAILSGITEQNNMLTKNMWPQAIQDIDVQTENSVTPTDFMFSSVIKNQQSTGKESPYSRSIEENVETNNQQIEKDEHINIVLQILENNGDVESEREQNENTNKRTEEKLQLGSPEPQDQKYAENIDICKPEQTYFVQEIYNIVNEKAKHQGKHMSIDYNDQCKTDDIDTVNAQEENKTAKQTKNGKEKDNSIQKENVNETKIMNIHNQDVIKIEPREEKKTANENNEGLQNINIVEFEDQGNTVDLSAHFSREKSFVETENTEYQDREETGKTDIQDQNKIEIVEPQSENTTVNIKFEGYQNTKIGESQDQGNTVDLKDNFSREMCFEETENSEYHSLDDTEIKNIQNQDQFEIVDVDPQQEKKIVDREDKTMIEKVESKVDKTNANLEVHDLNTNVKVQTEQSNVPEDVKRKKSVQLRKSSHRQNSPKKK